MSLIPLLLPWKPFAFFGNLGKAQTVCTGCCLAMQQLYSAVYTACWTRAHTQLKGLRYPQVSPKLLGAWDDENSSISL